MWVHLWSPDLHSPSSSWMTGLWVSTWNLMPSTAYHRRQGNVYAMRGSFGRCYLRIGTELPGLLSWDALWHYLAGAPTCAHNRPPTLWEMKAIGRSFCTTYQPSHQLLTVWLQNLVLTVSVSLRNWIISWENCSEWCFIRFCRGGPQKSSELALWPKRRTRAFGSIAGRISFGQQTWPRLHVSRWPPHRPCTKTILIKYQQTLHFSPF